LGLVVGSYLNVVVHRLPRGISTVAPRSRCPVCGSPIRAIDNVPVVSFLLLRGRCRRCATPIPWRYPLVEATTGALFAACFLRFGASASALTAAILVSILLALALIDAEHYLLPDRLTVPGIAAGVLLQPLASWARIGPGTWGAIAGGLLGAAAGAALLAAIWGAWYLLRGEEGMGLGDLKMNAAIGAFLGWQGMLVGFLIAVAVGSAVGLSAVLVGRLKLRSKLPFGVFLALGGGVALFAGGELVAWYGSLLGIP
jgi:leader peptidase (prepilin peptidase)/N-methyltransferase